jgi:rhamnosyltransferase
MNDIRFIERTLKAICGQNFKDFELVNVDSGSTDGTFEIVKQINPDKSYQIKPQDYVPGKVLNNAVKRCAGEIIVFNNSDCVPQSSEWLENLIAPLRQHNNIATTFGNQAPRPDARPLVVKDHERAFGTGATSGNWEHFYSLATSAIRKSILTEYPFDENVQYSEDVEWSVRIKKLGYEIAYVPDAVVEHSHNYILKEVWKRFYNEGVAEGYIYRKASGFIRGFAGPFCMETLRDMAYLLRHGKLGAIPYGVVYRLVQKFAVWRGRRNFLSDS